MSGRRRRPVNVERIVWVAATVLVVVVLAYAMVHALRGDL